jgi:hypothetical protein
MGVDGSAGAVVDEKGKPLMAGRDSPRKVTGTATSCAISEFTTDAAGTV